MRKAPRLFVPLLMALLLVGAFLGLSQAEAARIRQASDLSSLALPYDGPLHKADPVADSRVVLVAAVPSGELPVDALFMELQRAVDDGHLASFTPAPEAGGMILEGATAELLTRAGSWPGVTAIAPLGSPEAQAAATGAQAPDRWRDPRAAPEVPAIHAASTPAGVGGLHTCSIMEDGTSVAGGVSANQPVSLTLRAGDTVKSMVQTTAGADAQFTAYFTATIRGGDTVVVTLPDEAPIEIYVPPLTLNADKATDLIQGVAPAGNDVKILYWSSIGPDSWWLDATADGSGHYSVSTQPRADMVIGDTASLQYTTADGFWISLAKKYVTGLSVDPFANRGQGYAAPGAPVSLTLRSGSGSVKGTASALADTEGWFSTKFSAPGTGASGVDILTGDRVDALIGSEPAMTVTVTEIALTGFDFAGSTVSGLAPAGNKVEVNAEDDYQGQRAAVTVMATADSTGRFSAAVGPNMDLLRGTRISTIYHDAGDNEVVGVSQYAGLYVRLYLNHSTPLWVVGMPGQAITATLHSALGVVKGAAQGAASADGSRVLYFRTSTGGAADPVAGDQVTVEFAGAETVTVDAIRVDVVVDREARTVSGHGPANTPLLLEDSWYATRMPVTTTATGDFAHTFDWMQAGRSARVFYRNPAGHDVHIYAYIPKLVVNPLSGQVSGYGPANTRVVLTIKDSGGAVKGSCFTRVQNAGYFALSCGAGMAPGDTVVADMGAVHLELPIPTIMIDASRGSNAVQGTASPGHYVNVYLRRSFGPYSLTEVKNLWADANGRFSTTLSRSLRGGDQVEVWDSTTEGDQVVMSTYLPSLAIDTNQRSISGYATPGASGTLTVTNAGGSPKAHATLTPSGPYGAFTYASSVDIVPGDHVIVKLGGLDQDVIVPVLDGTFDLAADRLTGHAPPNSQVGVSVWSWSGSSFSTSAGGYSLVGFVASDAGGNFSAEYRSLKDLAAGDYASLQYVDAQDVRHSTLVATTQPTITVDGYPSAVQPGTSAEVRFTISGGTHAVNTFLRWDAVSHPSDVNYAYSVSGQGAIGSNVLRFTAPNAGKVYFRVMAIVDGRSIWNATEGAISVDSGIATVLIDPVSGATNDARCPLRGVAPPGATVTIYEGETALGVTTAAADGAFVYTTPTPYTQGMHEFHAISTVEGVQGPASNVVRLRVDSTLLVDPVHILWSQRSGPQHLRDDGGYAELGGRLWTRAGDPIDISIPISCTDVFSATLRVGGLPATALVDAGDHVYVGSFIPPGALNYSMDLLVRCGGPAGALHTIVLAVGLIDPDGFVYDAADGLDHRIAGATVTCEELIDAGAETWQFWNASLWSQVNPQTTGADGYYSFFTLPGKYRVRVNAPGYVPYLSPALTVVDEPVHHNVALGLFRYVYLPLITRAR